ncbi:hypothetical protein M1N16_03700 [Nitrospinaceae bacterium]|nr:hypothetical protein [Nitrospinaceae bacterium]
MLPIIKYRLVTIIMSNLVLLLTIDITAGLLYKKINGNAWYYDWKEGPKEKNLLRIKSNIYHHDLAKNAHENDSTWGDAIYTTKTNSLGFRDRINRKVPLKTEKKRLVFIGDSVTEGLGLNYEETFVGLIDNALKEEYSVLNAGVTSYSPLIYWKKIDYLINKVGLQFDELIVYLDVSDIQDEASIYKLNDTGVNSGFKGAISERTKMLHSQLIKENTILWAWLRSLLKKEKPAMPRKSVFAKKETQTYENSINLHRGSWTFDESIYKEYGEKGLKLSAKYMENLLKTLRIHGVKMTLAIYPWPDQIFHDNVDSKHVVFWENWAKKNKVAFVNHFIDFFLSKNKVGAIKTIEKYYIPGDVHLNTKGNILIKEYFLSKYINNKIRL